MNSSYLEQLEKLPTSMLKDVTDNGEPDLSDLIDHTSAGESHSIPDQNTYNPGTAAQGDNQGQTQQLSAGNLLPASLAVDLMDMILPVLIVVLMDKVFKKKLHKDHFTATPEEKSIIEPVLQKYLDSIAVNIESPLNALVIVLAAVYGTKIIEVTTGNRAKPDVSQVHRMTQTPRSRSTYKPKKARNPNETRGRKPGARAGVDFQVN